MSNRNESTSDVLSYEGKNMYILTRIVSQTVYKSIKHNIKETEKKKN